MLQIPLFCSLTMVQVLVEELAFSCWILQTRQQQHLTSIACMYHGAIVLVASIRSSLHLRPLRPQRLGCLHVVLLCPGSTAPVLASL